MRNEALGFLLMAFIIVGGVLALFVGGAYVLKDTTPAVLAEPVTTEEVWVGKGALKYRYYLFEHEGHKFLARGDFILHHPACGCGK